MKERWNQMLNERLPVNRVQNRKQMMVSWRGKRISTMSDMQCRLWTYWVGAVKRSVQGQVRTNGYLLRLSDLLLVDALHDHL